MASPAVSTPSSAGSPAALAPAPPTIAIKSINDYNMATIASVSGVSTPTIVTRKEWIIPPRPKPGRKPATDTPPTKRKAQNRAAQRAFRERRAARVGELEELLEETKEEQIKRESGIRDKIIKLEAEVLRFSGEVQSWKFRCDTLDRIVDYERKEKEAALAELSYLRNGARTTGTDAVPLPPRRARLPEPRQPDLQPYTTYDPKPEATAIIGCGNCTSTGHCACVEQALAISTSGCGKCTVDSHCECLEETIKGAAADMPIPMELKRPHSPSTESFVEKRQRQSHDSSTPLEVDFTEHFSSKADVRQTRPAQESVAQLAARSPAESCGFCEEGTYCMCAEAAAPAASNRNNDRDHKRQLAPLLNEVTPPPSDTDVGVTTTKLPWLQPNQMHQAVVPETENLCVNGPGTCQQCRNDPKSGLFCRSLATIRENPSSSSSTADGCCGGNASGGGCCKSLPLPLASHRPPSLTCADTYKTLSTHKNFDEASDELSTWLGRLNATTPHHAGRAPMEVEAASVMGVLRFFDRRFGRE